MQRKAARKRHGERGHKRSLARLGPALRSLGAIVDAIQNLGRLVIAFSRVKRASVVDQQGTHESDTDHTVMLAVLACAAAARCLPQLDVGKVAQYALVHDLVEAYCGDVATFQYDANYSEKKSAEEKALRRIKAKFKVLPWLHATIEGYESLGDAEARFVKSLDKAMPALLLLLTDSGEYVDGALEDPKLMEKKLNEKNEWFRGQGYARDENGKARPESAVALDIGEEIRKRRIARQREKVSASSNSRRHLHRTRRPSAG